MLFYVTHTSTAPGSRDGRLRVRSAAPPRLVLVQAALIVVGVGLGGTTALAITAETASQLAAPGGWATFGGSLTGLVGTYLALVMVLLVSRIPFVERVLGQDGLLRWHRWLAPWPIGLLIAHAHVIVLGPSFVGHPLTQLVWSAAWLGTAGLVLSYRFGLPVVRSLRHRLRVVEVRAEGPGVTSVIVSGRHLDRLAVCGGQFFLWRFLTPDLWWQAHPYSLSALPRPPYLRLTVKNVGDHSSAMARLKPGTAIVIEGPYGIFTRQAQQRRGALLVAAGIGVTALRALLEDLPPRSAPVVILRASREADLVLRAEVTELVRSRRGRLHELVGSREQAAISERSLRRLVPDLDHRDVYVCGPEGFVAEIVEVARSLGIPGEAIHHEAFAL